MQVAAHIIPEFFGVFAFCQIVRKRLCFFFGVRLSALVCRVFAVHSKAEAEIQEIRILIACLVFLKIFFIIFIGVLIAVIYLQIVFVGKRRHARKLTDHVFRNAVSEHFVNILFKLHIHRRCRRLDAVDSHFHTVLILIRQLYPCALGCFTQHQHPLKIPLCFVHERVIPCDARFLVIILLFQALCHIQSQIGGILSAVVVGIVEHEVCDRSCDLIMLRRSRNHIVRKRCVR